MNLQQYFENSEGLGTLSTADSDGNVDSAIYSSPHVISEDTIAFIMRPRLSFANIEQNPKAVYMYIEKGPGYQGQRLYLEKTGQEDDPETVNRYRRSSHGDRSSESEAKLVYFKVTRIRPLVGDGQ
jgi:hypothetical protein